MSKDCKCHWEPIWLLKESWSTRKLSTQYYSITFEMREIGSIESILWCASTCMPALNKEEKPSFVSSHLGFLSWEHQGSPKAHLAWWDVQARNLGNKLLLELQSLIITSLATKSYKYDEIKPFQCHCSQLQGVFPYDPQPCRRIERWEKNLVSFW